MANRPGHHLWADFALLPWHVCRVRHAGRPVFTRDHRRRDCVRPVTRGTRLGKVRPAPMFRPARSGRSARSSLHIAASERSAFVRCGRTTVSIQQRSAEHIGRGTAPTRSLLRVLNKGTHTRHGSCLGKDPPHVPCRGSSPESSQLAHRVECKLQFLLLAVSTSSPQPRRWCFDDRVPRCCCVSYMCVHVCL